MSTSKSDSSPRSSVLQKNIESPKTPGEKFFPPFEVTKELEAEAKKRIAHIGIDRGFGYGLKYAAGFKDTHLGRV